MILNYIFIVFINIITSRISKLINSDSKFKIFSLEKLKLQFWVLVDIVSTKLKTSSISNLLLQKMEHIWES